MKRLVRDLIRQKGLYNLVSVASNASIFEALSILETTNSSAILVTENDKLVGIFSEKDFTRAAKRKNAQLSANVESVMTKKVYYVEPSFTLEECLQVMSKFHIRHLPVIENGRPVALLSMRHIMEVLVEDKDMQIRELTTYIVGTDNLAQQNEIQKNSNVPIYFTTYKQEVS